MLYESEWHFHPFILNITQEQTPWNKEICYSIKLYYIWTCWEGTQIAKFMGPTWVLSVPGGPHVGPINLVIRECVFCCLLVFKDLGGIHALDNFSSVRGQIVENHWLHHGRSWYVMTWKGFLHNWPFVRGIHWWLVDSLKNSQLCRSFIFFVISIWNKQ